MTIRATLICVGLLFAATAFAQMGGMGGGGGDFEGRGRQRAVMPNIERETMILSMPDEWHAAQPLRDANKMDFYMFGDMQGVEPLHFSRQ